MHYLCHLNGTITTDTLEMSELAVGFYSMLYNAENCDPESAVDPQLGPDQQQALWWNYIPRSNWGNEIAIYWTFSRNRWVTSWVLPKERKDYHEVLLECLKSKILPVSCHCAVLSLKNWRLVSLRCLNYKILSKCLANRLKGYLSLLIQKDQTYCIPERSIMDNLLLIRDVIGSNLMIITLVFFQ